MTRERRRTIFRVAFSIFAVVALCLPASPVLAKPSAPSVPGWVMDRVVISDKLSGSGVLEDHSPHIDALGNGWNVVRTDWQLTRQGTVETTGTDESYRAVIDSGLTNIRVACEIRYTDGEVGLVYRYKNENNWHMLVYDGRSLRLIKSIDGVATELAGKTFSWGDRPRSLEISAEGDVLSGSIDGKAKVTATDHDLFGQTRVGIYYLRKTQTKFANFNVFALGPEITPQPMPEPVLEQSVVYDSFTDADGTNIEAHAPDIAPAGSDWTETFGEYEINGGQAWETTNGDRDLRVVIDGGTTDQEVHARVTWVSGLAGVTFRYMNETNWFMTWYDGENFNLAKVTDEDGFQVLGWTRYQWGEPGTTRHIRVRNNDKSIRVYIDDTVPLITAQDESLLGATSAGLFTRKGDENSFDYFAIMPAEALPEPDPELPPPEPPEPPAPAPEPPEGAVIFDSFNDWSYAGLMFHEPDLAPPDSGWEIKDSAWGLISQYLTETTGTLYDHRAVIDSGRDDVAVTAEVTYKAGRAGVVARYRNEGNWIMFWYDSGVLMVAQASGGLFSELSRVKYNWPGASTKTMSLLIKGAKGYALINGKVIASFSTEGLEGGTETGLFYRPPIEKTFNDFAVFGLGSEPEPPAPIILVDDKFTDADGASLPDHSPEVAPAGSAWAPAAGEWSIVGEKAQLTTTWGDGDQRCTIETGYADEQLSADVVWNNGLVGLTFRYADESSWMMLWYNGTELVLGKLAGGIFSVPAFKPFTWGDPGTSRQLRVLMEGDSVKVFADNNLEFSVTDTQLTANTKAGFFSRFTTNNAFDNFLVTRPAE